MRILLIDNILNCRLTKVQGLFYFRDQVVSTQNTLFKDFQQNLSTKQLENQKSVVEEWTGISEIILAELRAKRDSVISRRDIKGDCRMDEDKAKNP